MKKAVIFDLDGTLVNSIPFHFKTHKLALKMHGINLTKHFFEYYCNGTEAHEAYSTILKHYLGSDKMYEKIWTTYLSLAKKRDIRDIKVFSGVKSTLKKLKFAGIKMGVASSSHEDYVRTILNSNKLTYYFDIITGSDYVKHSKPNPAIFLNARRMLNVAKRDCVVIEDTINGAIAAKRAGIDCLCLLTSEKREEIPKFAKIVEKHTHLYDIISRM